MNPGLVIKLRPTGPWRIGPDSGARNQVDAIYHSDSLYSAVASAMARLGQLEQWLDATARSAYAEPAVCFGSCYPFMDEIGYVVPPRSVWPPVTPGISARVRWKSVRFVPLGIVQAILAGQRLDENQWVVDGPSECLAPAGRPGPFRTGVRWSAAVDRLTGATERHSTACIEFRPGAGLWTVASFADEAARDRWLDLVKAAFRLLADSGFGGERSRGWGRSEPPEFIEGILPEMILGAAGGETVPDVVPEVAPEAAPEPEGEPAPPVEEPALPEPPVEDPPAEPSEGEASVDALPDIAPLAEEPPVTESSAETETTLAPLNPAPEPPSAPEKPGPPEPELPPAPEPSAPGFEAAHPHWLLSLFTPAAADAVDWTRGNYVVLSQGGRVESPAASGELKKQVHMLAEGSVVFAVSPPRGAAADVAPDGFAHPVYRAGFAVAIPLPEAH